MNQKRAHIIEIILKKGKGFKSTLTMNDGVSGCNTVLPNPPCLI